MYIGHTINWNDSQDVKNARLEFSGIPFVIAGKVVLDCFFGKERHVKQREERDAYIQAVNVSVIL